MVSSITLPLLFFFSFICKIVLWDTRLLCIPNLTSWAQLQNSPSPSWTKGMIGRQQFTPISWHFQCCRSRDALWQVKACRGRNTQLSHHHVLIDYVPLHSSDCEDSWDFIRHCVYVHTLISSLLFLKGYVLLCPHLKSACSLCLYIPFQN